MMGHALGTVKYEFCVLLITYSSGTCDFLKMINFTPPTKLSAESNERYEYTVTELEHTFTIRFDFDQNLLNRFSYEKDSCVIYD